MTRANRSRLVIGILFILIGIWFLLAQWFPELGKWVKIEFTWPLIVIGVGIFLLFLGLLTNEPGLAVPACIVGGIGGLLYWQNSTGNWGSWSYAWTLIPGFVGIGILISGLLEGKLPAAWSASSSFLLISFTLFLFFSAWLGGMPFGRYWPVLLILLGVWLFLRAVIRSKR